VPTEQSQSFRELGAFLVHKTGSGQVWNNRYRAGLDQYIEKYGADVLIGACLVAEFTKVEYAFEIWGSLDNRTDDQEWWIPAARERYHAMKQRLLADDFKDSPLAEYADALATTTRRKRKWNAADELKKIQERTGLPRGPEAEAFRRKWNL